MYKCIIAEDEKQIRNGLCNYFDWSEAGFNILGTAGNGKEALELIKKYSPHLVITDIKMPVMDGLELMEHALKIDQSIKFIVLSGYDDFEYAKKAIAYGVCDYILKPLNTQELNQSLTKVYTKLSEETSKSSLFDKGISLLKDDFLKNIAKGIITGNNFIQKKAWELGININEYMFYVIRISIEDESFYTAGNKNSVRAISIKRNTVSNIARETINKHGGSCIFNDYENQISIIFYISKRNMKNAYDILQKILRDVKKSSDDYINCKVHIGLGGEFSDIYSIKGLYEKSDLNLQNAMMEKDFSNKNEGKIVNAAMLAIKKSELKDISLESIAKQIFISPYYLSRVFKQETGENFVDYVTKIRIEKAKELISNFNLDNDQVADIIGYSSTKYFLKVFKKCEGVTPKEFKKTNNKIVYQHKECIL
ncbi:MAG TPA: response regulator [Clostridiales bacterium]|nr:response regulator [Clostridiales bacterium]